jgi:hypothetical protein
MSATPLVNEKYSNIFGDYIYKYDWKKAIENKYICDFNIIFPDKMDDINIFKELLNNIRTTKYKLDKICDVINVNHIDYETVTQYTYLKYYYDFFRPYRRLCDLNRLVHFNKLEAVKKACLVCKILFYAFYYSI